MHWMRVCLLVGVGLAIGGMGWVFYGLADRRENASQEKAKREKEVYNARSASSGDAYGLGGRKVDKAAIDREVMKEVFAIEAERNQWDQTYWAKEIVSHKFGDEIVDFWDRLKEAEDPLAVAADITFDELQLANPPDTMLAAVLADFSNSGTVDMLCADPQGLILYAGRPGMGFEDRGQRVWEAPKPLKNTFVITAGDIDRDGDLDAWIGDFKQVYVRGQMPTPYYNANDGFPAYLLVNQGNATFQDRTEASGLAAKRYRRSYTASFVDLNASGHLDLLVVSDFCGVDMYFNNGNGHFRDVTNEAIDQPHLFGMGHTFGDYNRDGTIDFFVTGMTSPTAKRMDYLGLGPDHTPKYKKMKEMRPIMTHGSRMYLGRGDHFKQPPYKDDVADTGWSWGTATLDFDNNGYADLAVVNGHASRKSTRDYESRSWRHDFYVGSSEENRAVDIYLRSVAQKLVGKGYSFGGYDTNRLLANQSGNGFLEVGFLMGFALRDDSRNVVATDLDRNGRMDLVVRTKRIWPEHEKRLVVYKNQLPDPGNWIGFELVPSRDGIHAQGATIEIRTSSSTQIRPVVTGDSFRSQHPLRVHFGIGDLTEVQTVVVRWPHGEPSILQRPKINRYHLVTPKGKGHKESTE